MLVLREFESDCADSVCVLGIPVGRTGRPEEIADTVLWMVNTAYVTNKIITVDGGLYPC